MRVAASSPLAGGLVESDIADLRQIPPFEGLFRVMSDHAPKACVVHIQLLRQGLDGHSWSQGQDQRLEKQSKPAALTRPRDGNQMDATGVAVNPWDPGRKVSLILKEIEMSPGFFKSIFGCKLSVPSYI